MRKGYRIDPVSRTIEEVEFDGLTGMQSQVGGYIECAYQYPNGDAIFVDEEGLLKGQQDFFWLHERADQPFAGRGLMVGHEIDDAGNTAPPMMSIEALRGRVRFDTLADLRNSLWARRSTLGGDE